MCVEHVCSASCRAFGDCKGGICLNGGCLPAAVVDCASAKECAPFVPVASCMVGSCANGRCAVTTAADGASCSDDKCAAATQCKNGACLPGTAAAANCDDGNACTQDGCLPNSGCFHTPMVAATCADADPCTTDSCVAGTCSSEVAQWSVIGAAGDLNVAQGIALRGAMLGVTGTYHEPASNLNQQAMLTGLSLSGQIQFATSFGGTGSEVGYGVCATPAGFALVGLSLPTATANEPSVALLVLTTELGAEITNATVGVAGLSMEFRAVTANSGGVRAVGSVQTAATQRQAFVADFSAAGKPKLEKELPLLPGYADMAARAVALHPTAGAIVGGVAAQAFGGVSEPWVAHVAADGAVLWSHTIQVAGRITGLAVAPDGIAAVGQYAPVANSGEMWLWRLDLAGNTLGTRHYPFNGIGTAAAVVATPLGLVLVGNVRAEANGPSDWWAMRVDRYGNPQQGAELALAGNEFATGAVLLPDGGFAISGFRILSPTSSAAIVGRANRWGYLDCAQSAGCTDKPLDACGSANPCLATWCDHGCQQLALPDGAPCGGNKTCTGGNCGATP